MASLIDLNALQLFYNKLNTLYNGRFLSTTAANSMFAPLNGSLNNAFSASQYNMKYGNGFASVFFGQPNTEESIYELRIQADGRWLTVPFPATGNASVLTTENFDRNSKANALYNGTTRFTSDPIAQVLYIVEDSNFNDTENLAISAINSIDDDITVGMAFLLTDNFALPHHVAIYAVTGMNADSAETVMRIGSPSVNTLYCIRNLNSVNLDIDNGLYVYNGSTWTAIRSEISQTVIDGGDYETATEADINGIFNN